MKKTIFIFFLIIFSPALVAYCQEGNPHQFNEYQCSLCHNGDPSSPLSLLGTSPSRVCVSCHTDIVGVGYSHPVDIAPEEVNIPKDMPLTRSGLVTCNTCHGVHSSHISPFGSKTYFLRRETRGKAFCVLCHTDSEGHALMFHEAHFQSTYVSSGFGDPLDSMTKNCASCHDGTYGTSVVVRLQSESGSIDFSQNGLGQMHPVGMDYQDAVARNGQRRSDLRPRHEVDPRIQFFDDKVGCGSCHNPFSSKQSKLVMSNRRSALCFACHVMG